MAVTGFLLAWACAPAVPAQDASACADSLRVSWYPEQPRQGAMFEIRVAGVLSGARLSGRAAGERLHFTPGASDSLPFTSLAGAPIDAATPLPVEVHCVVGADSSTIEVAIDLAGGEYPLEKLRVAPRFSAPPDSALQARMRREAARAAAVSAASHETPRLWEHPFRAPRDSRITSGFGSGREFNGTVTSRHMGTDYAGATGAPVRAANRGVVRLVDSFFLGGNVVYLDHGAGVVSAYLHLSRTRVAVGDTVEQGAVIGEVGATGRVTGPHLHLITRYGGISVDPLSLLALGNEPVADSAATGEPPRRQPQ